MDDQENMVERIARQARERKEAEGSLSEHQDNLIEGRSSADVNDPDKGTKEDNQVSTDVKPKVDIEPVLAADGSRSPHDASSDGGSRQEAAHAQVRESQAGGPGSLVGATERAPAQVVEGPG